MGVGIRDNGEHFHGAVLGGAKGVDVGLEVMVERLVGGGVELS